MEQQEANSDSSSNKKNNYPSFDKDDGIGFQFFGEQGEHFIVYKNGKIKGFPKGFYLFGGYGFWVEISDRDNAIYRAIEKLQEGDIPEALNHLKGVQRLVKQYPPPYPLAL